MVTETLRDVVREMWLAVWEFHVPTVATLVAGLAFVVYYLLVVAQKPAIRCGQKRFENFLLKHCPALSQKVWITPFCFDGRLHTVLCYYVRALFPDIKYTKRELIRFPDGGYAALDWLECKRSLNRLDVPTILILPGLNGHSQITYVKPLVVQAHDMGYRCVVFNYRGKAGVKLYTAKIFCPTDYSDLSDVIVHIRQRFPGTPLLAVGTSLGGVILGHYISHVGAASQLDAAMLVSTVFDVTSSVVGMATDPLNCYFSRYLTSGLLEDIKAFVPFLKATHKGADIDMDKVFKSQTLVEFDTNFTIKLYGYDSVEQFYQVATLNDKLKYCKTPTLAICAHDDPFQLGASLPTVEDIDGAPVALAICRRGGHLGFQEGFNLFKRSWGDRMFRQFCRAVLEFGDWKRDVAHG